VVLLDCGGAIQLGPNEVAVSTPGVGGTLHYTAPERELEDYDDRVDIWSMGVIFYEFLYGWHPWPRSKNPWRVGNERMRVDFHADYDKAVRRIRSENDPKAQQSKTTRHFSFIGNMLIYLTVGDLLLKMFRHPWAHGNDEKRISIKEVLQHQCWEEMDKERSTKKLRAA
jgi:serine/threonine protein kinase